jgi:nucleolar MIF4G domain-containing protein 1
MRVNCLQSCSTGNGPQTKFEELLALENKGGAQAAADIELERRLAKKLKGKDGKVKGPKDGFDELLGGLKDFGGQEVGAGLDKGSREESGSDSEEGGWEGSDEEGFEASDDDGFGGLLGEDSDSEGSEGLGFESESEDEDVRSRRKERTSRKGQTSKKGEERERGKAGTGGYGDLGGSGDDMGTENEDDSDQEILGSEGSGEEQGHGSEGSDHESVPAASGMKEKVIETDIFGRPKSGDAGGSAAVKYVPPHLRAAAKGPLNEEMVRLQRRIRGLLNRLTEANVESITSDMVLIFQVRRGSRM